MQKRPGLKRAGSIFLFTEAVCLLYDLLEADGRVGRGQDVCPRPFFFDGPTDSNPLLTSHCVHDRAVRPPLGPVEHLRSYAHFMNSIPWRVAAMGWKDESTEVA